MKNRDLNLYVWRNILWDYTDGGVAVLAHSEEEAKKIAQTPEGEGGLSLVAEHFKLATLTVVPVKNGPAAILAVWGGG
jgi:hypothetical protein